MSILVLNKTIISGWLTKMIQILGAKPEVFLGLVIKSNSSYLGLATMLESDIQKKMNGSSMVTGLRFWNECQAKRLHQK